MTTGKRSLLSVLLEVKEILTPEVWTQGAWFSIIENGFNDKGELTEKVCMCAHGAVEVVVNPRVKTILSYVDIKDVDIRIYKAGLNRHPKASVFSNHGYDRMCLQTLTPEAVWGLRTSSPVYEDSITFDAHFILGMVGLTVGFNDNNVTTYKDVIMKLDRAIVLAQGFALPST